MKPNTLESLKMIVAALDNKYLDLGDTPLTLGPARSGIATVEASIRIGGITAVVLRTGEKTREVAIYT